MNRLEEFLLLANDDYDYIYDPGPRPLLPWWLQIVIVLGLLATTEMSQGVTLVLAPISLALMNRRRVFGTILLSLSFIGWPIAFLWPFLP